MSWVDMTPDEARRKMIAAMRLDAEEGEEGEEEERPQEQPKGGYGNTRLPYGLCKRFGIDLPDDATPRDAWTALEKGTGYTHDEVMDIVKKAGDTKDVQAKKGGEGETAGESEAASGNSKGEVAKKAKSLRGMGAKEHKHFDSMGEAQSYLSKELGVSVNYAGAKGLTTEKANAFNDAILTVADELGIKPDSIRGQSDKGHMCVHRLKYKGQPNRELILNICNADFQDEESNPKVYSIYMQYLEKNWTERLKMCEEQKQWNAAEEARKTIKMYQEWAKYRAWITATPGHEVEASTFHEMGHVLVARLQDGGENTDCIADAFARATKENKNGEKDIYRISCYAATNKDEFFSECFAGYLNGMELPDYCNEMVETMIGKLGKGKEG